MYCSSRLRSLSNGVASLNWLVLRNALCIGKKLGWHFHQNLCAVVTGRNPLCYAFFYCSIVYSLWKLIEGYMVCILRKCFCPRGQLCLEQYCVITEQEWTQSCAHSASRRSGFAWCNRRNFMRVIGSLNCFLCFKHQFEVNIKAERKQLFSLKFSVCWVACWLQWCQIRAAPWHQIGKIFFLWLLFMR